MKEQEQSIVRQFPLGLKPQDRLFLEMAVVDEDPAEAQAFLTEHGITITKQEDPLRICKGWFREIRKGERGKLEIRFTDKGPTMDINA